MSAIYNHKTISFCWPFGLRDSGMVGKPKSKIRLSLNQGYSILYTSYHPAKDAQDNSSVTILIVF